MYTVYVLQSLRNNKTYVGYTKNLKQRFLKHNSGQVKSTKRIIPCKILFSENFESIKEAKNRELWWKSSTGRRNLKKILKNILVK